MVFLIVAAVLIPVESHWIRCWIVLGLAFGLVGDVLLFLDRFNPGAAAFLVGHLAYVVALLLVAREPRGLLVGGVIVLLVAVFVGRQIVAGAWAKAPLLGAIVAVLVDAVRRHALAMAELEQAKETLARATETEVVQVEELQRTFAEQVLRQVQQAVTELRHGDDPRQLAASIQEMSDRLVRAGSHDLQAGVVVESALAAPRPHRWWRNVGGGEQSSEHVGDDYHRFGRWGAGQRDHLRRPGAGRQRPGQRCCVEHPPGHANRIDTNACTVDVSAIATA